MPTRWIAWTVVVLSLSVCGVSFSAVGDARVAEAAQKADWRAVETLIQQKADVNVALADGSTALHFAVRVNDLRAVDLLIRSGASVDVANRYRATPLNLAVENVSVSMVEKLLTAGAKPEAVNAAGETVLMTAARVGSPEIAKMLLAHNAAVNVTMPRSGHTALLFAILHDHPPVARLLIEGGANIHTRSPKMAPVIPRPIPRSAGEGIARLLARVAATGEMTPLMYAARSGRFEIVKMLLAAGAKVNEVEVSGASPLLMATLNNQIETAKFLLEQGADPNSGDEFGRAPLWAAVDVRNVGNQRGAGGGDRPAILDLIQALLDRGATPNARTKELTPERGTGAGANQDWVDFSGMTAFFRAAMAGDTAAMRLLLKYGADPNIPTFDGATPLMAAAGLNSVDGYIYNESDAAMLEAVKLCVELGADVNQQTQKQRFTALHGAAYKGADPIVEYLVSKGADLMIKDSVGRTAQTWAEGVFVIGARPKTPRPSTMKLIEKLLAAAPAKSASGATP